ncbi:MAG: hypothetical protein GAK43_01593 [Stenotrophomonas maltophilia]|nr:MAG: hypothetical protein GAK43_01593 [Stenotrophomonas maltophilia]
MPERYSLAFEHALPGLPQQLPLPELSAECRHLEHQLELHGHRALRTYLQSDTGTPQAWRSVEDARTLLANLREAVQADPKSFNTAQGLLEESHVAQEQIELAAHHGAGWRLVLTTH